jgi:hypothetical protein
MATIADYTRDWRIKGLKDNDGRPRLEYCKRVIAMTDEQLMDEARKKIWLSAYANNNPRSDYHWHVDVIYTECKSRREGMYKEAYDDVYREHCK